MNSTVITSVALLASVTALTISGWGVINNEKVAEHTPVSVKPSITPSIEAAPVANTSEAQHYNSKQEMDAIIQYLAAMEGRMTELANRLSSLEDASPALVETTLHQDQSLTENYDDNQMAPQTMEEELEQRFSQLEGFYLAGVSDANATTIVDEAFMHAVDEKRLEGSINTDLNCHDTLCKISASHDNPQALDNYIHQFASIIPWGMAAEIKYDTAENGIIHTTFYVSREEDLPPLQQP